MKFPVEFSTGVTPSCRRMWRRAKRKPRTWLLRREWWMNVRQWWNDDYQGQTAVILPNKTNSNVTLFRMYVRRNNTGLKLRLRLIRWDYTSVAFRDRRLGWLYCRNCRYDLSGDQAALVVVMDCGPFVTWHIQMKCFHKSDSKTFGALSGETV
jgi:hypothetical protein